MSRRKQATPAPVPGLYRIDMLSPRRKYFNKLGRPVPGATTVVGILDKPALARWHNSMGLQGINTQEYVKAAADIGTTTHARSEAWVRGLDFDKDCVTPELMRDSEAGYRRFIKWWTEEGLEVEAVEQAVISEAHQAGGTLDIRASRGKQRGLVDLKTSNAIYREHKLQVCGYNDIVAAVEGRPFDFVVIARLGKLLMDDVQPYTLTERELECGARTFRKLCETYWLLREFGND